MSHRSPLAFCCSWAALALGMLLPAPAGATDYAITSFADVVAADGTCTLREALRASQNNMAVNECAAGTVEDTIVLESTGVYGLQASSGAVDAGVASFPSVGAYDASHAQRVIGAGLDLGAFERAGLFADGFESGAAWAWSASAP